MYKRDYTFRMNVMEEIFEIRSCIEILANENQFHAEVKFKFTAPLHSTGNRIPVTMIVNLK